MVKFSTKDCAKATASRLALTTRGKARVFRDKKRKALEKKSSFYIKGF